MTNIVIKRRGCNWPIAGGTYAYVDPEKFDEKHPVWEFVVDPTYPVPEGFPIAPVSMVLKSRGQLNKDGQEIYDIYDWIGSHYYPNPLDWLLEVQQLGFHQKMNPTDIQWLTPESMYFAVHERAAFVDPTEAYVQRLEHPDYPVCPTNIPEHINPPGTMALMGTCVGLFFNDIIKGTKPKDGERITVRECPSFSYDGFVPVDPDAEHIPAIFFRLPIGRMAQFLVYEDTQNNEHETALAELDKLEQKMKRVKLVKLDDSN